MDKQEWEWQRHQEALANGVPGAWEAFVEWHDALVDEWEGVVEALGPDPEGRPAVVFDEEFIRSPKERERRRTDTPLALVDCVTKTIVWPSANGGPPVMWDGDDLLSPK